MEEKGTETVGSMFKKMKNKPLKISLIVILSVIMLFSCFSMALYYFMPVIEQHTTYSVGLDKNGNPYIYVEYHSNKENNGVEVLDIKFSNYATIDDFSKNDSVMYYKGIQFVGDNYGSINFDYSTTWSYGHHFMAVLGASIFGGTNNGVSSFIPNVKSYYYDSQNGVSFKSFEELDEEYRFKISIQEDDEDTLYWMKFYGNYESQESDHFLGYTRKYYENYDLMNFAAKCLDVCRTNSEKADANGNLTISVGTMFDFMPYTTYAVASKWESANNTSKVKKILEEYSYINFKIYSDGAKQASDSMFGIIADSSDFEYINPNIKDNYLFGQQAVNLTEKHFTLVDGKLDFTTKTKAFLKQNQYVNMIIEVDNNILKAQGITYTGFADDVKVYKDRIISFVVKNTQNGQTIYSEVVL